MKKERKDEYKYHEKKSVKECDMVVNWVAGLNWC